MLEGVSDVASFITSWMISFNKTEAATLPMLLYEFPFFLYKKYNSAMESSTNFQAPPQAAYFL